jgi:superfamily II RNA helicase
MGRRQKTEPAEELENRTARMGPPPAFPFPLDEFQLEAIDHLRAGRSVVVCAPTGSGKTVVGEYGVQFALTEGGRVFYTTPLKALSNQKYRDFVFQIGADNVGLLTGDISILPEAPVVVMTTEVFRNMLYSQDQPEGRLRDVRFVVLDECHYLNDAERGTVWEESIIRCPSHIRLIALSATIANPQELTAWMSQAHGPTSLVLATYRPVPLRYHVFKRTALSPLLRKDGTAPPAPAGASRRSSFLGPQAYVAPVDPADVVEALRKADMLPAIYFVFSRRGCEGRLEACSHLSLLTTEETARLEEIVSTYVEANPYVRDHPLLPCLSRGLAVHHAGMLPAWKVLVERLFQANLIKAVFATETLAAGINMPARTTVISALTKRGDEGWRTLTASEFHQMAGRAGRRGMDPVGHVVVLRDPYRPLEEAARLATAPPDPLLSRFTPTYGLVLNLLRHHSLEEAEHLLRRSFGQFQAEARAARLARQRSERGRMRRKGRRGEREAGRLGAEAPSHGIYWGYFMALKRVLERYGYVEDDRPTEAGLTAAALRTENELLVAEALRQTPWEEVTPAAFAAVITALATEEPRPGTRVWARAPREVEAVLVSVRHVARRLRHAQRRYGIDVPAELSEVYCGLTHRWASAARWQSVVAAADLDEGDVVQMIRRTLDLLRQIPEAPGLSKLLVGLAREAARQLDREPVRELP